MLNFLMNIWNRMNDRLLIFMAFQLFLGHFMQKWYFFRVFTWFQVITHHIGLVGRVFVNGPGDLGSIPGRVIPNTLKMVLDISSLNTQQY